MCDVMMWNSKGRFGAFSVRRPMGRGEMWENSKWGAGREGGMRKK